MTNKEIKEAMGRPELLRLKQIGKGLRVVAVNGNRVLVETIEPETDLDRVQREGSLYIPEHIKKDNTPKPATGIILEVGNGVDEEDQKLLKPGVCVLFSKYAGLDFAIDELDGFKVLDTREILCILEVTEAVIAPVIKS